MATLKGRRKKPKGKSLPKIDNHTSLRGDDLRRLIHAVIANTDSYNLTSIIRFRPTKSFRCYGYTYSGKKEIYEDRREIVVYLGKGWIGSKEDVVELAQIIWHELLHRRGLEHRDMEDQGLWWHLKADWAAGITVRHREGLEPSIDDIVERQKVQRRDDKIAGMAN